MCTLSMSITQPIFYSQNTPSNHKQEIFNGVMGNMLAETNLLTWNVWFVAPTLVDKKEWRTHAERWRESIDADHGSSDGAGSKARNADGSDFTAIENLFDIEKEKIETFLKKHEIM